MDESKQTKDRWHRVKERARDEVRRLVVMFIYLWVMLGLFVLNERIILGQVGISYTFQGFALINALILAKVMLIFEDLHLARWLRNRPLIYPILFESLLLTILFICFHVVEHVVIALYNRETIGVPSMGGGGLVGVICVAFILFVSLIPFFAFRNLDRRLGGGQLMAMLFRTPAQVPDKQ